MKARLIALLRYLLLKLDPPKPEPVRNYVLLTVLRDALFEAACELVKAQEANYPERSGESKRHQVLAELIKRFPEKSQRAIALAIEAAL